MKKFMEIVGDLNPEFLKDMTKCAMVCSAVSCFAVDAVGRLANGSVSLAVLEILGSAYMLNKADEIYKSGKEKL